ncbi:MAG: bifunctional salicylyl-CoA 5-hydroxylase/oxidoreductase [Planctomycetaceae bacterium]|nr:bifunctional salicylyl-CoA 5-hydroxylase/oxidoreductase [Planctomycetota bacterium]NUN52354.1 bifunctional salicylyl-CoA 5-hydroxylase/oxidoreductase [Planctomycetaceae bacterium]
MNIVSIGGGPAGLYFSILAKRAFPEARIRVFERNRADDAFGWGVVFSRETLDHFREADPESYDAIRAAFVYWDDIETFHGGARTVSRGHGFCGFSRKRLLNILQERAAGLGVEIRFEKEVDDPAAFRDADLVVAADGVNSRVRERLAAHFRPEIRWGTCRFAWLGTDLPMRAFTFVFRRNDHGLFQVHAYPYERNLGTWIVECDEATWRRAGLDTASEAETIAYCEGLFREDLRGHRLMANRSLWRSFPLVTCAKWSHGNVVLLGDAAHTAHFSIGSGTKLAMEDAISLVTAMREYGSGDPAAVLAAYEEARRPEVARIQRAARTSQSWFEESERWMKQDPIPFTFNLMTRSKRITWGNLRQRDPALVDRTAEWFRKQAGAPRTSEGLAPPPAFTPFRLRGLEIPNRIVVSPMCQYSAVEGVPQDWHLVHLGSRAVGGAGLVFTEMTDVSPEGRITRGCAGIWNDGQAAAWRRIVAFVHGNSRSRIGMQIAHAGRKASCSLPWEGDAPLAAGGWETMGPSALPFREGWPVPREMTRADMDRVREDFVAAAVRAAGAGFDLLEVHAAHGYLLSSFTSPLSNRRTDGYGGPLENRMRFPREVVRAVRAAWPADRPLAVRISASDWVEEGGVTPAESVAMARMLKEDGVDVIDVSSGGNSPESKVDYGRMYQVPFADRIRHEAGIPVIAVGAIQGVDHANTILAAGRADLVAMARPHLADPHLALHAAAETGFQDMPWPNQYLAAKPRPRRGG